MWATVVRITAAVYEAIGSTSLGTMQKDMKNMEPASASLSQKVDNLTDGLFSFSRHNSETHYEICQIDRSFVFRCG